MKENPLKHKTGKPHGSLTGPIGDFITTCPVCRGELELWQAGSETVCIFCNHKVFKNEKTVH